VADGCEAAPLVRKYEAGMVYEPTAGESAAEAIRNVAAMGMDEREQVRSNAVALAKRFDREKLARFVESTLKALVAEKDLPIAEW
jgi:glycosyltransferase involved in cell wall biosynthesis